MVYSSPREQPIQYRQCDWGDWVQGSKVQLQALGIGLGAAFPGEPGAPRRNLKTHDIRGFDVIVSNGLSDVGVFHARIKFPGWPEAPDSGEIVRHVYPGVQTKARIWFDEHTGRPEDLVSAGLVRVEMLPGAIGMRKTRVAVRADGSLLLGPPTSNRRGWRIPGASWIERISASTFRVGVIVSKDEEERRRAADSAARRDWEETVNALPRPARLDMLRSSPAVPPTTYRSHLRLVWSAPP